MITATSVLARLWRTVAGDELDPAWVRVVGRPLTTGPNRCRLRRSTTAPGGWRRWACSPCRRAAVGGSWRVRVALARTAIWLDDLGRLPVTAVEAAEPSVTDLTRLFAETESQFGRLRHVRCPGTLPGAPPRWNHGPRLPDGDPPRWW